MRAAWILALTSLGCSDSSALLLIPPEVTATLLLRGASAQLHVRGQGADPLILSDADSPLTALHFTAPMASLRIEADEDGELVRASEDALLESTWPLPLPASGSAYRPETLDFVALDADVVHMRAQEIRVPAPSCGRLVFGPHARLPTPDARVESMALVDDVTLWTTRSSTHSIAYLVRGDSMQPLTLSPPPDGFSELRAFAAVGRFILLRTTTRTAHTYEVALDGTTTLALTTPMPTGFRFHEITTREGSPWLFGLDYTARAIGRLEADGTWEELFRLGASATMEARCATYVPEQAFELTSDDEGVVGFAGLGALRFGRGMPTPVVPGSASERSCHSAYVRFASGGELAIELVGIRGDGTLDLESHWRSAGSLTWLAGTFPTTLKSIFAFGDVAVAHDFYFDDVVVLANEPLRPEQRPRLCAKLGTGDVRGLAFDGRRGVVAIQAEPPATDIDIQSFTYEREP